MKKVIFTAFAAMAFAFAMTACGGGDTKKADENKQEQNKPEQVQDNKDCNKPCAETCMCGDECKAKNCEGCPNHGTDKCCKAKEGKSCEQACEQKCQNGEAKECEHKCAKAEGKDCCKKAEGKECEHKCQHEQK